MLRRCRSLLLLVALTLALAPQTARADDLGFTILWFAQLILFNPIAGLISGLLIMWRCKSPWHGFAIFIMITASYLALVISWGFSLVLRPLVGRLICADLAHARLYLWGGLALMSLAIACVLWLGCVAICWKSDRRWRRSFKAFLIGPALPWAVLLGLYISVSDTTIVSKTRYERSPATFAKCPRAWIYYISLEDGAIWRRRLDGSPAEKMTGPRRKPDPNSDQELLCVWTDGPGKGKNIWCLEPYKDRAELVLRDPTIPIQPNVKEVTVRTYNEHVTEGGESYPAPGDLRPDHQRHFNLYRESIGGLYLHNEDRPSDKAIYLNLTSPILEWESWGIFLPGDQLVAQFGNLVILLDVNTWQMSLIAQGRGPAVVLE